MRTTFRPRLEAGETDAELLALGASGGALASGCAWLAMGLPLPPCVFHAVTGCPCPVCGATRCVLALLHGHPGAALAWNPLVFMGLVGAVLLNLYSAGVLAAGLPRARLSFGRGEGRLLRLGCALLLAANWAYEIHRGV